MRVQGYHPQKIFENSYAKSCILVTTMLISGLPFENYSKEVRETNTLLVPQPKSWGTNLPPPVPMVVAPMQDCKHQLCNTHLCLQTQQVMYFLSNLSSVARGALQFSQRYRGASSNISCTTGQFSRHASHLSMFQSTQSLHAAHGNTKIRAVKQLFFKTAFTTTQYFSHALIVML